ncbi:hypothetical protein Ahy_A04g018027 isoform C [Arachis hypogaea]|uniref:Uncharacterized protein n=1 Tax=Arachis hypogaea TaxID=3818 RepID=A0A445DCN4_ARAHY|nr:hypothetical protein Ahy_A04g018027 isoform C [Arachis hypogaea]
MNLFDSDLAEKVKVGGVEESERELYFSITNNPILISVHSHSSLFLKPPQIYSLIGASGKWPWSPQPKCVMQTHN